MSEVEVVALPGGVMAGRFRAMASPCEVLVDGASASELAELTACAAREAWRIEAKWSRYRQDNIVHALNTANGCPVELDEETARLVSFAAQLHDVSGGRFDLTSGALRRVWRFTAGAQLPDWLAVERVLDYVGWHKVKWTAPVLRLRAGMEIDFGGVGKEYAADRALALLMAQTDKAILVNFGGDLATNRPRADGSAWIVGIDSGVANAATPVIRLRQGGVASSGDTHRHLVADGHRYGHVLDPRTGWPPPEAPRSVTVACRSCVEAGAMSTIALLHGADAERWLRLQQVDFHVVR